MLKSLLLVGGIALSLPVHSQVVGSAKNRRAVGMEVSIFAAGPDDWFLSES
jgi:hypothetical protein